MTRPAQAVTPDSAASSAAEAVGLELAARDLYAAAIEAGASDPIWDTLRKQHESYAQMIAGILGISASTPDAEFAAGLAGDFASADPSAAAVELENTLATGHTARLVEVTDTSMASALASIITAEARQATVIAQLAGETDPAVLYTNPTEASA